MSQDRARPFLNPRLAASVAVLLVATACGATPLAAQAKLVGTVRDSAGVPIAGAEVGVESMTRTATTGRRGTFELSGVGTGNLIVAVRRLGYARWSTTVSIVAGDNRLPDIVLTPLARELDTVAIRDQQILREHPLLREFEENRRIGLGQFVTRADLAKMQGGFMSPVFNQMRGLLMVRSLTVASHTWIATTTINPSGVVLEDRFDGEVVMPPRATIDYCYPVVYLDQVPISSPGTAVNIGRFSPDQLQAIEVYLNPAETPLRYSNSRSLCGVIVFHTRVPDPRPRGIARVSDGPTRSRIFANVSLAAAKPGADCLDCARGSGLDAMLGYTFNDRWVITGRYARWTGASGGPQAMTLRQALVEWYPHPEPGRVKWFVNAGAGSMSIALHTAHGNDYADEFNANGLPAIVAGTGVDIALASRMVITPVVSHTRTVGGRTLKTHCLKQIEAGVVVTTNCYPVSSEPTTFNLTQIGTRIGWR
jgi:hypothetical protein